MIRLPLFPLPVVLVPEAPLPLHIFEPRYRRMVAGCLEGDRRFGLIYHDSDVSGPFLVEKGRVGCVAEIMTFEMLDDGRSLVLTKGVERFSIVAEISENAPFYEAWVEPYEDVVDPLSIGLPAQRRASIELFDSVLATQVAKVKGPTRLDPDQEVSFRLAATVRSDPEWLQALLELRDEGDRLAQLDQILRGALGTGPAREA